MHEVQVFDDVHDSIAFTIIFPKLIRGSCVWDSGRAAVGSRFVDPPCSECGKYWAHSSAGNPQVATFATTDDLSGPQTQIAQFARNPFTCFRYARRMRLLIAVLFCLAVEPIGLISQTTSEPIIDVHLHALPADNNGPPPVFICAPYDYWPAWNPQTGGRGYEGLIDKKPPCATPLRSAETDEELMRRTLDIVNAHNVIGVASGPLETVEKWKKAGGNRILPAIGFDPQSGKPALSDLRQLVISKRIMALAEVTTQYAGVAANDERMEPYYNLAEQLDIPVGIHMGPGPPGVIYFGAPEYRMRLSSLLLLEDVLARHPKLRLWAMHAGWPFADDTIAALYAHPQLYVDVGVISYAFPRQQFYSFIKRLIDAGFENRIMFGSDQMVWPEALSVAIDVIQNAPILSDTEKRDILYNNAARFLRLKP